MEHIFRTADMLIPKVDSMEDWAVIACDQFTSEPEYWERVARRAEGKPSAAHLILPEADLTHDIPQRVRNIQDTMRDYLDQGIFAEYPDSYIYVERTLSNGRVRRGLLGAIDLEAYDFHADSVSPIRASEQTVLGRIPVRRQIREGAMLELSHVLLLADDDRMSLIAPFAARRKELPKLYDFELMEGGGHIRGWLVQGAEAEAFDRRLKEYMVREMHRYDDVEGTPLLFAVGDGNHSIVTAKEIYEAYKKAHPGEETAGNPLRYTTVELENLYDDVQEIESIFRIVTGVDTEKLLRELADFCAEDGYPVTWCAGGKEGVIHLDPARGPLAVSVLQDFLDYYLSEEDGEIDYIHGAEVVRRLAEEEHSIGFLMDPMDKTQLFPSLKAGGPLTRKTFSMGRAREKRYYLEARRIR